MPDDSTTEYVLRTHPYFEDLKQVAAQLAGLLVLDAAGAAGDHSMLASAREAHRRALDGLRSARVPARVRAHHRHLLSASVYLYDALHGSGDALIPLRYAYDDLRAASKSLPGFQMISFDTGCCAHYGAHR
jgi:hypothetical protein